MNIFSRCGMGLCADGRNKGDIKLAGLENYSYCDSDGDVPVPPVKAKGKKAAQPGREEIVTLAEADELDAAVNSSDVSTVIGMPLEALLEFDRRSQDDSGSESDLEIDSSPEGSDDEEEK